DRRFDLPREGPDRGVHVALRGLQLHQDRAEALCEVVVDVAREPVTLLENGLAALLDAAALDHLAGVERQRRLTRARLGEHRAPPARAVARGASAMGQLEPAERAAADHQWSDDHAVHAGVRTEIAQGLGQPFVSLAVL